MRTPRWPGAPAPRYLPRMRSLVLAAIPVAFLAACCTDGSPAPQPPAPPPAAGGPEAGTGPGDPGAPAGAAIRSGAGEAGGAATPAAPPQAHTPAPAGACRRTGCAGELCAAEDLVSPCIMRPEFACYVAARCERQADGACGWTGDAALQRCLAEKRAGKPADRLP
ncbi:conserved hypothetical protein [Anaeromyxobacter dehalogenans 2CP-1]|uniref:Lipoprotein n=2 Tax=Anaeromyxobacter dehalogenans TaxID=161493 RepID=B8JFT9_ANAD2|nr:conserved hypothetical protein [Anaeromyxobacter dehalogenans 2CP-1]